MARQPSTPRIKTPAVTGGEQQGTQPHADMMTDTTADVDHDVDDIEEEQGLAANDAPEPDEALDMEVSEEEAEQDDDEDMMVRMLHPEGVQHVNGHPLENGTVIGMKRKDFDLHQKHGVAMEEVGDDYDGEVYDVSEPWAPEVKEEA